MDVQDASGTKKSSGLLQRLKNLPKKQKIILAAAVAVILILTAWFILFMTRQTSNQKNDPTSVNRPNTAIAKVGDEYIFQEDLDIELANYPGTRDDNTKKMLLQKLVSDSIVVQAADKDKILALNPAVYNLSDKDYGKRISDIKAIEKKINSSTDQISGGIVSVWFHNYEVPAMGLEKAKQTAFDRVSALHQRVLSKEITIAQAGNIIKSDPFYAQLDVGYKNNAFAAFSDPKGDHISVDENFNKEIWKLRPGEITPVFLGWNVNGFTNQEEEAFYAFAQVEAKVDTGNTQNFNRWLEAQKPNYEVIYY